MAAEGPREMAVVGEPALDRDLRDRPLALPQAAGRAQDADSPDEDPKRDPREAAEGPRQVFSADADLAGDLLMGQRIGESILNEFLNPPNPGGGSIPFFRRCRWGSGEQVEQEALGDQGGGRILGSELAPEMSSQTGQIRPTRRGGALEVEAVLIARAERMRDHEETARPSRAYGLVVQEVAGEDGHHVVEDIEGSTSDHCTEMAGQRQDEPGSGVRVGPHAVFRPELEGANRESRYFVSGQPSGSIGGRPAG
jgi:hypothetical protein